MSFLLRIGSFCWKQLQTQMLERFIETNAQVKGKLTELLKSFSSYPIHLQ